MATKKKVVEEEPAPIEAAVIPPPPGTPEAITPQTPLVAAQQRVLYENAVNDGAARFAEQAKAAYIDATLAGGSVDLVVTLPEE